MKPTRRERNHKAAPPITGTLTCPRGHQRLIYDFNPEQVTVKCAQVGCGHVTSLSKGFSNEQLR